MGRCDQADPLLAVASLSLPPSHSYQQTHVDNSFGDSFVFTHTNVLGTHILLEVARECMPVFRRFVHISTDEVYGENTVGAGVVLVA